MHSSQSSTELTRPLSEDHSEFPMFIQTVLALFGFLALVALL